MCAVWPSESVHNTRTTNVSICNTLCFCMLFYALTKTLTPHFRLHSLYLYSLYPLFWKCFTFMRQTNQIERKGTWRVRNERASQRGSEWTLKSMLSSKAAWSSSSTSSSSSGMCGVLHEVKMAFEKHSISKSGSNARDSWIVTNKNALLSLYLSLYPFHVILIIFFPPRSFTRSLVFSELLFLFAFVFGLALDFMYGSGYVWMQFHCIIDRTTTTTYKINLCGFSFFCLTFFFSALSAFWIHFFVKFFLIVVFYFFFIRCWFCVHTIFTTCAGWKKEKRREEKKRQWCHWD